MKRILPLVLVTLACLPWASSAQAQPKKEASYQGKTVSQWVKILKSSKTSGERQKAARALDQIGPAAIAAVPALQAMSQNDPDSTVRRAAARALKKIQGK